MDGERDEFISMIRSEGRIQKHLPCCLCMGWNGNKRHTWRRTLPQPVPFLCLSCRPFDKGAEKWTLARLLVSKKKKLHSMCLIWPTRPVLRKKKKHFLVMTDHHLVMASVLAAGEDNTLHQIKGMTKGQDIPGAGTKEREINLTIR